MAEPLFDIPTRAVTERQMLDALQARYGLVTYDARRYAVAEHAPVDPYGFGSIADFVAVDCWRSSGFAVHGHEVKCSRSDWLRELRDPGKALAWSRFCHRWWLVVSDTRIVHDGELPAGWGLLTLAGSRLRRIVHAPKLTPEPMLAATLAGLLRATAKTARRSA